MSMRSGRHLDRLPRVGSGGRVAQLGVRDVGDEGEEEMPEQEGSREALVLSRRAAIAGEAFQALEGDLDAPSQPVERADPFGIEGQPIEGGDEQHPFGSDERFALQAMLSGSGGLSRLLPARFGPFGALADGDKPQPFERRPGPGPS